MNIEISIVIPTLNRIDSLKLTLKSIFTTLPENCEVIVVDQSMDSQQHCNDITNKYPDIIYICEKKMNLPNARNIGIKASHGEIILFFDDDIIVHKNCISAHIEAHKKLKSPIISGRTIQTGIIKWADINEIAQIDFKDASTNVNFDCTSSLDDICFAVGCHFSVKRNLFNQIGLFDSAYIGNALYEDLDFSFRAKKKNHLISYISYAIIDHKTDDNGGCRNQIKKQYLLHMLHNRTLFYIKHIKTVPSLSYIIYLKNLIEYICRIKKGHYSFYLLFKSFHTLILSYFNLLFTPFRIKQLKDSNL